MSGLVMKELTRALELGQILTAKRKEISILEKEFNELFKTEEARVLTERLVELLAESAPKTEKTLEGLKISNENIAIGPLATTLDPKKFLCDDNPEVKLYIYTSFKNHVLASARTISKRPGIKIASYDLTHPMSDMEIRTQFGDRHIFDLDDFFHALSDLLKAQPNGDPGELLDKGRVNLFHVRIGALVLVVDVSWNGSDWDVHAWEFDGFGRWDDGDRVFSFNG